MRNLLLLSFIFLLISCKTDTAVDIQTLPSYSGDFVNVVIEIPAGTNHKIEYNYASGRFENDQIKGMDRIIQFLPYPGNYGFIPGTLMEKSKGGDGDALDILLLGESLPTATVVKTKIIGALLLRDNGEIDTKLIGIPAENPLFQVNDFMDFAIKYDAARRIIEDWFLNYKGRGAMEFIRWEDENYALEEIKKWQK